MKILILGNLRSGSTTLFNALYKSMEGYKGFCEPYNPSETRFGDSKSTYSLEYSNLIVKILPWDLHSDYSFFVVDNAFQNNMSSVDFIKSFIINSLNNYVINFDKVILLNRKNKLEQAQSYSFASRNNLYHNNYEYDDNFQDLSRSFNLIKNHDDILDYLSNNWKIPLIYYEDLFLGNTDNINNFVKNYNLPIKDFKILYEYLNPKNRYRQR